MQAGPGRPKQPLGGLRPITQIATDQNLSEQGHAEPIVLGRRQELPQCIHFFSAATRLDERAEYGAPSEAPRSLEQAPTPAETASLREQLPPLAREREALHDLSSGEAQIVAA